MDPILAAMERAESELGAGDLIHLAEMHIDSADSGESATAAENDKAEDTSGKQRILPSQLNMKSFETEQRRIHRRKRGKTGKGVADSPYQRSRSSIVQGSRIMTVYVFSFASNTVFEASHR